MFADLHNLQLPFLCCQLSKSAPNILWSVGSSIHNQFWQIGRVSAAVMVAKMSLSFEDRYRKTPGVAKIGNNAEALGYRAPATAGQPSDRPA
jgi:hypothetical protein